MIGRRRAPLYELVDDATFLAGAQRVEVASDGHAPGRSPDAGGGFGAGIEEGERSAPDPPRPEDRRPDPPRPEDRHPAGPLPSEPSWEDLGLGGLPGLSHGPWGELSDALFSPPGEPVPRARAPRLLSARIQRLAGTGLVALVAFLVTGAAVRLVAHRRTPGVASIPARASMPPPPLSPAAGARPARVAGAPLARWPARADVSTPGAGTSVPASRSPRARPNHLHRDRARPNHPHRDRARPNLTARDRPRRPGRQPRPLPGPATLAAAPPPVAPSPAALSRARPSSAALSRARPSPAPWSPPGPTAAPSGPSPVGVGGGDSAAPAGAGGGTGAPNEVGFER